jgi:2-(1,2-epoxy-1,2-dihydrophenyl)acetyl-CoA isomerase
MTGSGNPRTELPVNVWDVESVPGIEVTRDGALLGIQISRPEKRNALDDAMIAGLIGLVEAAGNDETVRAILLFAAGDHFCAGADIVKRNSVEGRRPRVGAIQRRLPGQAHRLIPLILSAQTPVVCAVRGWAAGIGLALALAADFTVTSTTARFWAPFCDRGFTPDSGTSWMLPRRIGEVRARRMLLLGEQVTGEQARDWGLVHSCVTDTELDAAAGELAGQLAGGATVALGLTKSLLHLGRELSLSDQLRQEAFAMELSSRSEDFREGLAAFQAKRPAEFTGR